MQTEGLKIVVGFQLDHANVLASVSDQFKQVEKSAQGASGAFVKVAGSLRELDARQKSFVQSAKAGTLAYQQLGKDVAFAGNSINKLTPAFNTAQKASGNLNQAFAGLNNIVRDAPYGINGVANNITQLTDALFGASLAANLVTLGLSLAVTAAVSLSQKYGSLSNAIDELLGPSYNLNRINRDINKTLLEGQKEAQKEVVALDSLYKAATDLNIPLTERNKIIDRLQKDYPKYLGNLSNEQIAAGKASVAYNKLRDSIIATAQARAIQDRIAEIAVKLLDLDIERTEKTSELTKAQQSLTKVNDQFAKSQQNSNNIGAGAIQRIDKYQASALGLGATITSLQSRIQNLNDKEKELNETTASLFARQSALTKQFGAQVLGVEEVESSTKTVSDVLSDLRKELTAVDQESKKVGLSFDQLNAAVLGPLEKAFEEIAKIGGPQAEKALQSIGEEIRKVRGEFIGGETLQTTQLITFERAGKIKAIAPEFNADLVAVQQNAANFANTMGELGAKAAENFQKRFIVIGDALSGAISPVIIELEGLLENALAGIAVGIGEAIGGLITGAQGLTDVFNGLLKIIGTFIKEFGQALIVAATTRIIAEKSLVANPYLALAAGIAAVAAGAALQNIVPSFATGGTVMGPQLIMAGDNPGRKEHILSDAQLQTIAGSNVRDVRVYGVVRGRDIHLLNQEAINEGFRIN